MSQDSNDLYLKSVRVRELFNNVCISEHTVLWVPTSHLSSSKYYNNRPKCATTLNITGDNYEYVGEVECTEEQMQLTIKTRPQNPDNKMYINVTINTEGGKSSILQHEFVDTLKAEYQTTNQLPSNAFKRVPSFVLQMSVIWIDSSSTYVSAQLSADFEKLHVGQTLTDVTFVLNGDTEIVAHKAILAARSPVFQAMFQSDMLESKGNQVVIKDLDRDIFEDILRHIYTGKLEIRCTDKVVDLMVEADAYALIEFRDHCEMELIKTMNIDNVADTLIAADLLNLESLKTKSFEFILSMRKEFFKTDGYKNSIKNRVDLLAELLERS